MFCKLVLREPVRLIAVAFLIVLSFGRISYAEEPADDYQIRDLHANEAGWITWVRETAADYTTDIFLSDGARTIQVTNDKLGKQFPRVNANGWVVWETAKYLYLFNGEEVIKIPGSCSCGTEFDLNDRGWVVWSGLGSDQLYGQIYLYDGEETVEVTKGHTHHHSSPMLNNNGQMTWHRSVGQFPEVFFYDGKTIRQLTEKNTNWGNTDLSDNGLVTWYALDNSRANFQIFKYNGNQTTQITNSTGNLDGPYPYDISNSQPRINSHGWITWNRSRGYYLTRPPDTNPRANDVYLYNNRRIIKLNQASEENTEPKISDLGWVMWSGLVDGKWEVFMSDGTDVYQVTNNGSTEENPQLTAIWDRGFRGGNEAIQQTNRGLDQKVVKIQSAGVSDQIKPSAYMRAPFVSTKTSKTTTFKITWSAADPETVWKAPDGSSENYLRTGAGIASYTVQVRRANSPTWRNLRTNTTATYAYFTGKAGRTYYFRVAAKDHAGNVGWSKARKTTVPLNEGAELYKRVGFNGYQESGRSQNYLSSIRYSYRRGHALVYKIHDAKGIGLIVTKGNDRGRARIYVDNKYVKTIDTYSSKARPRQLIFYKGFEKKGTHYLKVVNLGTPGRARFEVDGIVAVR